MLDELATGGVEFEHCDGGIRSAGEFEDGESDGTGADDENIVGGGDLRAVHGMAADGERLDEGELLEVERVAGMQFVRGKDHALAHAAVAMDAEDLQCLAAVGAAALAGMAGAAVQVRLDGATVADFEMRDTFTDGEDFDAENFNFDDLFNALFGALGGEGTVGTGGGGAISAMRASAPFVAGRRTSATTLAASGSPNARAAVMESAATTSSPTSPRRRPCWAATAGWTTSI